MAAAFEKLDRASIVELAELYDPDIPVPLNEPYVKRTIEVNTEWAAQLQGQVKEMLAGYNAASVIRAPIPTFRATWRAILRACPPARCRSVGMKPKTASSRKPACRTIEAARPGGRYINEGGRAALGREYQAQAWAGNRAEFERGTILTVHVGMFC